MPSKRKRSGPGFNRDDPAAVKRSKPAYNQVYRVPSRAISGPGIYVTCVQGKERKAALQFIDLLNEVADRLYPGVVPEPSPEQAHASRRAEAKEDGDEEPDMDALRNGAVVSAPSEGDVAKPEEEERGEVKTQQEDGDIAAQIAAELQDIKASERSRPGSKGKSKDLVRFRKVETDTECFLFISIAAPFDPYLLVYTILSDVELSATCSANAQDLTTLSRTILPQFFGTSETDAKTFKIDPRIRSHSTLKRNDVIQIIASNIPTSNPTDGGERKRIHTANLTNPDYWVVVEVVKNSAAISVVKDYERFKKLNLQSVAQAANEKKAKEDESETGRIGASLVAKPTQTAQTVEENGAQVEETAERLASPQQVQKQPAQKEQADPMASFRLF